MPDLLAPSAHRGAAPPAANSSYTHRWRIDASPADVVRRTAPVVELVGLAGAGKTTLRRALADQEPRSETRIRIDRRRESGVMARAALRLLPMLAHAAPCRTRLSLGDAVQLVRLRALRPAVIRAVASSAPLVVLDEGPVFALAKLEAYAHAAQDAGAFGRLWSDALAWWREAIDVVVWLDAPDDLLVQRIRGRAKPHRLKSADTHETLSHLTRYREAYATVVTRLCTAGGPRLLRIDTSAGSSSEQVARLLAELQGRGDLVASSASPQRAD